MSFTFEATIYKVGINGCVDVPTAITQELTKERGYIHVAGQINGFRFEKALVPVKAAPYRLFVNQEMMRKGHAALGEIATFIIEQAERRAIDDYPMPPLLRERLEAHRLTAAFERLTPSRRKDILKYLSYIKSEAALTNNIDKLIERLKDNEKTARIP